MNVGERAVAAERCTLISAVVNFLLALAQIVVGIVGHAQSLVADGFHSLADLLADGLVLFANRQSQQPADLDHPYGHARIETIVSLALGIILGVTGLGFVWVATDRLLHLDDVVAVSPLAFWTALASLVGKELLFRYMRRVGESLKSAMLVANAWHARADAASSLVVAIGLAAAIAGVTFADALAALIVGLAIIRMGWRFVWEAVTELVDTGVSSDDCEALGQLIASVEGVVSVHELRTRQMAQRVLIDVHLQVGQRISVSEGHAIAEKVRHRIVAARDDVLDVLVHIDPEDDQAFDPSHGRQPDRQAAMALLRQSLPGLDLGDDQVTLHYLAGKVEADVFLPKGVTPPEHTVLPPGFGRLAVYGTLSSHNALSVTE